MHQPKCMNPSAALSASLLLVALVLSPPTAFYLSLSSGYRQDWGPNLKRLSEVGLCEGHSRWDGSTLRHTTPPIPDLGSSEPISFAELSLHRNGLSLLPHFLRIVGSLLCEDYLINLNCQIKLSPAAKKDQLSGFLMQSMVNYNKGNVDKVLFEDHNFSGIAFSINIKLI